MSMISDETRRAVVDAVSRFESGTDRTTSINANSDGAGISFGLINWSQKGGGLYELLVTMWQVDPARFGLIFGPAYRDLLIVASKASKDPVDGEVLWREPWLGRFRRAGADPVFAAVQWASAEHGSYMQSAIKVTKALGLSSRLALAAAFDRSVQQGAGRALKAAQQVAREGLSTERARLERFYQIIAPAAGEWSSDVLRRGRELLARGDLASAWAIEPGNA